MTKKKTKKRKTLPGWAGWLIGYVAVLAAAAGLAYYWRGAFALAPNMPAAPFTLAVMGVASLLYLVLLAICRLRGGDVCLKAALLIFSLGLLFCYATAPLQAPDEDKHFLRAYAISQGHFTYECAEEYPDDVHLLRQHFPAAYNHTVAYQGAELATDSLVEYRLAVETGEAPEEKTDAPVMFMLLPFLPGGLFMAMARLFGCGALGLMYAGRIANLLVYTLLCYLALRNTDRYRGVMLAVCLLPLSLFMGASCSYDGLMLALCYVLISYFCKAQFTRKDLWVFLAVLVVATYIKPHNFVFAGLLLLIPKSRWKAGWNPRLVTAALAAGALVFWWGAGWLDANVLKNGYPALARGSGDASDPMGQVGFVLSNPASFGVRLLLSVYEADGFLFDLGRFGWMDLVVPLVGGLSVLSLALGSALAVREEDGDKTGAALGLLLLGLLYGGAVLVGMYVLDTDLYSIRVTGQQPRYFLPAFALAFTAGSVLLGKLLRPRARLVPGAAGDDGGTQARARGETITLWAAAALALVAAVLLFQNYYIGQWIPKAEGGWKLVNLFGWVQK